MKGILRLFFTKEEYPIEIPVSEGDVRARARIYICPFCWESWARLDFPVTSGYWSFYISCVKCSQPRKRQIPGSLFYTEIPFHCEEYDDELISALPLALHLRELDLAERHIKDELSFS